MTIPIARTLPVRVNVNEFHCYDTLTNYVACRLNHDLKAVHFQEPYVIREFLVMYY